ncbi:MAG: hypothetical protein IKM91_07725, partial [Candidatus Methanomethylophilaceae archaeon]|nr:hypothetical protein [Candidatus Methanomethylophilaceae archaeon]
MRILNNSPYLANMHAGVGIYKSLYIEPIYTELRETHTASQDMENHDPHLTTSAEGIESEGNKGPTIEELMKELASEKAMNKKYKASLDKATGEAADYKRQLNAKMSADEQALSEFDAELLVLPAEGTTLRTDAPEITELYALDGIEAVSAQ